MRPVKSFAFALLASSFLAAQSPFAVHFEFDQPGVLPSATAGVGEFNLTGSLTTTLFYTSCGQMIQQTIVNPTLGAGFFGGTLGAYGTVGPGLNPGLPTFAEARFTLLGGTGGPGSIPDSTGVLGVFPGHNCILIVNIVTGDVGLAGTSGIVWTTPFGTAYTPHVYRLETFISGGITYQQLLIDGTLSILPVAAVPVTANDGWAMGDTAGSGSISTLIAWDYVSIGQTPDFVGQANSYEASLFVNRSNTTSTGQQGLKGPFNSVVPGGSTLTLEWNGPAGQPFALLIGPQFPAGSNFGCIGSLDIGTPPLLADLQILFDPFNAFIGPLFWLNGCGYATQSFSVPNWLPGTPLGNFQGIVFQSFGCPLVLTAAHYVTT